MPDEPGTVPTQEEMQQGADVVQAGADAAAKEPDPAKKRAAASRAIKQDAKSKGWELSPEQANMLAGMVVAQITEVLEEMPGKTVEGIRQAGGFDKLPEPLTPPPAPTGTGELPAQPPAAPETDEQPGGGRARGAGSFARWFRSGG